MAGNLEAARKAKAAKSKNKDKPAEAKGKPAVWRLALFAVAVGGGLLMWAMFRAATPAVQAAAQGLIPWVGSSRWRVRAGQFIDPAAAASLLVVGESLDCTPMTLDVSREGGGPYPPHKSHQTGVDVDIRMSDIPPECRVNLQNALAANGWTFWYDGPDALAPVAGGKHKSHLHARFVKEKS